MRETACAFVFMYFALTETVMAAAHFVFEREGNNLVHKANVALKSALTGGEVLIKHLDGYGARAVLFATLL